MTPLPCLDIQGLQPTDTMLAWVKLVTFDRVLPVFNFSSCWSDGKIFCAILCYYQIIDHAWAVILDMTKEDRLQLAFNSAEKKLGITPIVDVDDIIVKPDAKCVQLYVSYWYSKLSIQGNDDTQISGAAFKTVVQKVLVAKSFEGIRNLNDQAVVLFGKSNIEKSVSFI